MSNIDLSILIPSRNEEWLDRTVQDLLENIEGSTDIIVVLDGISGNISLFQDPRVKVIVHNESIGQRAACNEAARLSTAKYLMKVDAHCAFDKGFDVKMLDAFKIIGDNVTMVPVMRNLWVFEWKCEEGHTRYQGPSGPCTICGKPTEKDIKWIAKTNPQSVAYCFDSEPHFQYDNGRKNTEAYKKGIIIGYNLWMDIDFTATNLLKNSSPFTLDGVQPSSFTSIINLLTDFTSSHQFTSSTNHFGFGKNMSMDAMGLSSVNNSGGIGVSEIKIIRDEPQVEGITTSPIFTNMVNNGNILSSASGNLSNKPSINQTMCEYTLSEVGTVSITTSISSTSPIPTSRQIINSNLIKELNNILGGEFIYNEKTNRFHNGSVALNPIYVKDLTETMSLQGSCFMLTKEKWFELNICDEDLGSWGSQGIETACKTWLSGGRVLVNHTTFYAHCFRTQGGTFGFPYPQSGKQVEKAKTMVRDLFFNNKWDKQIHPLSWLIDKFDPVPGWSDADIAKLKGEPVESVKPLTKGIIYYTDNTIDEKVLNACQNQIKKVVNGIEIVSASLKPIDFGKNIVVEGERSPLTMFKQILTALEASIADVIFYCEHDVLYSKEHFDFTPPDRNTFYYDENVYFWRLVDDHVLHYNARQLSGLCAYREQLIIHYRERIKLCEEIGFSRNIGFEPMNHHRIKWNNMYQVSGWNSEVPLIDIKHGGNLLHARWSQDQFRNKKAIKEWWEVKIDEIPGWENVKEVLNGNNSQ